MRKLRVGIWISDHNNPKVGGAYGYYSRLINELKKYSFLNAEIKFISDNPDYLSSDWIYVVKWKPKNKLQKLIKLTSILKHFPLLRRIYFRLCLIERLHGEKLKQELYNQVDIIYYLTQMCIYPNFPYIYTLWDIGHRTTFAFPELSMNGIFDDRSTDNESFPTKALMVFVESDKGKQDASNYLRICSDRIRVVPIFPSLIIDNAIIPAKPALPDNVDFFIFYNAQFWAHKNHFNLIHAFSRTLIQYPDLKLILTGSDRGNRKYIIDVIRELELKDSVIDLEFVKIEELKWLYLKSHGLVMPSFLGPTNMPLLEAAELGCPVACSNLAGHIEELGEYGYFFDPADHLSIADAIQQMISDKQKGVSRKYAGKFNVKEALLSIDKAFTELRSIRFSWGTNDNIR